MLLGCPKYHNYLIQKGSVKDLNFINYYSLNDNLISVIGSQEHSEKILTLRECLNLKYEIKT